MAGMRDDALLWCEKANTHRQPDGGEVQGTPSISCLFTEGSTSSAIRTVGTAYPLGGCCRMWHARSQLPLVGTASKQMI